LGYRHGGFDLGKSMYWWLLLALSLLCLVLLIGRVSRAAALALVASATLLPGASAQAPVAVSDINSLWRAQPLVMARELETLQPRVDGKANVYAIAVAAQGSQQLFSREAQLALQVAAARFGGSYRGGLLLSNTASDLLRHPLATRETVEAATRGIAGRIDPARDVVVIYLASHGSPEAWISTSLPTRAVLVPISAKSLAEALSAAGIRRRVIIISACFSASWIPDLANDDTIVITAAAKDRTSFGCDDTRRLTFFGEALLEGPLAHGASLRDGFEAAKLTVDRWEKQANFIPSQPQAFVGRNMQALWIEGTAPRAPASRKAAAGAGR
jgi:hypothetical protein